MTVLPRGHSVLPGTPEGVLTVLSGMTYMEHLQDNLKTYSPLEPCSDDELAMH